MKYALKASPTFLILIFLISISTFFSFYNLKEAPPGLYIDEAMNGNNALEALNSGEFKVFYPENGGREGLFINAQAVMISLFGNESWVLRAAAGIGAVGTVVGFYFLLFELVQLAGFQKRSAPFIAGAGVFLMETSFWFINFSRIGLRVSWVSLFLVWSMYLVVHLWKKDSKLTTFILAGMLYGIGFHTYIAYRITPLIVLALFAYLYRMHETSLRNTLKRLTSFVIGSIISISPLAFYFFAHPADFWNRAREVSVFASDSPISSFLQSFGKTFLMLFSYGDQNWRHNISGNAQFNVVVGIIFAISLAWGLYAIFKKRKNESALFLFFMTWFVAGMLPAAFSQESVPHALRSLLMIPPAFGVCALGLGVFWRRFGRSCAYAPVGIILLIFGALLWSYCGYFIIWAQDARVADAFAQNYVRMARDITTRYPQSTYKYVVADVSGVDVRGFPASTQTVMFLTDTFTKEKQIAKNIYYIFPYELDSIRKDDAVVFWLSK